MLDRKKYRELLQWHLGIERFDYDKTVDWAVSEILQGCNQDSLLILAAFAKPVKRDEIQPYVTRTLLELNLEEKAMKVSIEATGYYHVELIINNQFVKKNLSELHSLYLEHNRPTCLRAFYLLHYAWSDLEREGHNHYYETAALDNIEEIVIMESKIFKEKYINKDTNSAQELRSQLEHLLHTKNV